MANLNQPRGFKPVRASDNSPFSGGFNTYRVPSGFATALYAGDVVKLLTTGYLDKALAGQQFRGVAGGFRWTGIDGVPRFASYLPAGTATLSAQDILVEVYDDPNTLFEAQFCNSTTTATLASSGKLYNLIDTGGNAAAQLSGEGIDFTTSSTSSGQFRALRPVPRADNDLTAAYQRWEFVPVMHDLRVQTGV